MAFSGLYNALQKGLKLKSALQEHHGNLAKIPLNPGVRDLKLQCKMCAKLNVFGLSKVS